VPAGALFQRGEKWQCFVLADGHARLREVKAGHTNGLETEVLDGLAAGDRVILYPGDKVTDGARAEPMELGQK
jgi:HlyD family secretion protein